MFSVLLLHDQQGDDQGEEILEGYEHVLRKNLTSQASLTSAVFIHSDILWHFTRCSMLAPQELYSGQKHELMILQAATRLKLLNVTAWQSCHCSSQHKY